MNDLEYQYIRTKRELVYQECSGRYTTLVQDVPGFILNKDNIERLIDITEKQKSEYTEMLEKAHSDNRTLALVQGRICSLNDKDFYKCDEPKCYIVHNGTF